MTKQFAIAARDHGETVLDQVHGRVALWRCLPDVASHGLEPEDHLRDLLLARAAAMSVDGLQHAPCAGELLTSKTRVGWNGAAMKGGQEPSDGFDAIEAFDAERDHGHERLAGRPAGAKRQVEALPVGQIVQDVRAVFGCLIARSGLQDGRAIGGEGCGRSRQND